MEPKRRMVEEGIFLINQTIEREEQIVLIFRLDVQRISIVEVSADFSDSVNVVLEGAGGLFKQTQVMPFSKNFQIARLIMKREYVLKNSFKLTLRSPSKEVQYKWIATQLQTLNEQILISKQTFYRVPTNLAQIIDVLDLLKNKSSFIDPQFLPNNSSMFGKDDDSILDNLVHWRRPTQFLKNTQLRLIGQKSSQNDIHKGLMSSNAMISTLKILSQFRQIINDLLIVKTLNRDGIYRIKLCNSGEREIITIDDYFPCVPLDHPYFTRTQSGILWPLLVEKAIAKMLRGYVQLRNCQIQQVFECLTGSPSFEISLQSNRKLLEEIKQNLQKQFIVYGWVNEHQKRQKIKLPQSNHAYRLVKLQDKNLVFDIEGRQQAYNVQQTVDTFSRLFVTKLRNWHQTRIKGMFVVDPSSFSTVSQWYYSFDLYERTQFIVSICQQDNSIRCVRQQRPYLDLGLAVFKKSKDKALYEMVKYQPFTVTKNLNLQLNLQPGSYTLIPKTTGCRMKAQGTTTVYTASLRLIEKDQLREDIASVIRDLFNKYDLLMNKELDKSQMRRLFKQMGMTLEQQHFENLVNKYNRPLKSGHFRGFSLPGFIQLWKDLITRDGQEVIFQRLGRLGYDAKLSCSKSRVFVMAFNSSQQLNCLIRNTEGTDFDSKSNVILCSKGRRYNTELPKVFVMIYEQNQIYSYSAVNQSQFQIKVFLNCSQSRSAVYSNGTGRISKILQKNESLFLLHLQRDLVSEIKFYKHEQFQVERV